MERSADNSQFKASAMPLKQRIQTIDVSDYSIFFQHINWFRLSQGKFYGAIESISGECMLHDSFLIRIDFANLYLTFYS